MVRELYTAGGKFLQVFRYKIWPVCLSVLGAFLHLAELELPGDREGLQGVGSSRFWASPGKGDTGVKESTFGKHDRGFQRSTVDTPTLQGRAGPGGGGQGSSPQGTPAHSHAVPPVRLLAPVLLRCSG